MLPPWVFEKRASFRWDASFEEDESDFERLSRLYAYYDEVAAEFQVVCAEGCAVCCTRSVWVTRLEARWLLSRLSADRIQWVCRSLQEAGRNEAHSVPKMSLLASLTVVEEVETLKEEEEADASSTSAGRCPLLDTDRCTIYDARPFACRCMSSRSPCASTGFADQPERLLWMNVLFLQAIEHLDRQGFTGNLIDVVPFVEEGQGNVERFVPNMALKGWVLPPHCRAQLKGVAERLWAIIS